MNNKSTTIPRLNLKNLVFLNLYSLFILSSQCEGSSPNVVPFLVNVESRALHLHCEGELVLELLLARVERQVDPVEAGVGSGEEAGGDGDGIYAELSDVAVVALQVGEALGGDAGGSGDEL